MGSSRLPQGRDRCARAARVGASRSARSILVTAAVVLLSPGVPASANPPAYPVVSGGEAQPVFDPAAVVREDRWVRAPVDSDGDGNDDEVHVQVVRPAGATGKLPVVYQVSPYFAGRNEITAHGVDVELFVPGRDNPAAASGERRRWTVEESADITVVGGRVEWEYQNYFLARGFAVMYGHSLGTGKSGGCPTAGGPEETLGARAPIDWLNGRAPARDERGDAVSAGWASGRVGMIGRSYNGTLPNAVATTGVPGLSAIVPIAAISNWYDYYRAGGAVVAPGGAQGEDADVLAGSVYTRDDRSICKPVLDRLERDQDRLTGDQNRFWDQRDYLPHAGKVRAAVLAVHGLNDFNVKTKQVAQWYSALKNAGVPHKIWLHQSDHVDPIRLRSEEWLRTVNRWFTKHVLGSENGIDWEPKATIQREDGSWVDEAEWPAPGAIGATAFFRPGGRDIGGLAPGSELPVGGAVTESLDDDATRLVADLVAAPSSPNRLAYFSKPAATALRISGSAELALRASFRRPAANMTAVLVDRAPDGSSRIVTRGWADPQNRESLHKTTPITPDTEYTVNLTMQPHDYVLPPGHRLGIVVLSSDYEYTLRPEPGPGWTVNLSATRVTVPVVGGQLALNAAIG
ncbi:Xaa-Pro dipeptidyl-peptidase [Nocardia goodfellowii]